MDLHCLHGWLVLAISGALLSAAAVEVLAMEPIETILEARREASNHLTLAVDSVTLAERSRTGGLHQCRVVGRVLAIHRGGEALEIGDTVSVRLPCWSAAESRTEPPGPARIHYGEGAEPVRIDVYGRLEGREIVAADFGPTGSSASDAEPADAAIGVASMAADGTLTLQLRAETSGTLGDAVFRYAPGDPRYEAIVRHLGGIQPGETKPVPPFPDAAQ